MQFTRLTPATQLAFPFPAVPLPINNRGMNGDDDSNDTANDSAKESTFTRTSERKRGTFESKRSSSSSRSSLQPSSRTSSTSAARAPKVHTPAEAAQKLRNKALRLLTTREHSREELLRKLAQAKARQAKRTEQEHDRNAAKDDIEKLVDDLAAQGWQSDDRYAEAMVRRLTGQASKRFIVEKLAQAGIKKEAAQLAVEAIEEDDFDIAQSLWKRRYGTPPVDDRERQRHIRFLLSRGFHLGDAFKIVPRLKHSISYDD
jgi:regulatory protein